MDERTGVDFCEIKLQAPFKWLDDTFPIPEFGRDKCI